MMKTLIAATALMAASVAGAAPLEQATLAAPGMNSLEAAGLVLGCYVDTRAYDLYTPEECWSWVGSMSTGYVSFKIMNMDVPSRYNWTWSKSTCAANAQWCSFIVPKRMGQHTVSVTVTDKATGQSQVLSATATIEY